VAPIGPSRWAELVALAVALPAGDVPDGEVLGRGLIESGALADSEELRLLPGWRSPDALAELSFGAVRRVLLDLVNGRPPRDLPPGDTDELARRGFGVLLGLRIASPNASSSRLAIGPGAVPNVSRRSETGALRPRTSNAAEPRTRRLRSIQARRFSGVLSRPDIQRRSAARSAR
jgi:hypothetical protein